MFVGDPWFRSSRSKSGWELPCRSPPCCRMLSTELLALFSNIDHYLHSADSYRVRSACQLMKRDNIDNVLRSLRRVNLQGSFFGQTVAVRFGLSESDIETLEALIDMGATTAGRLAELTGLTSGAVTRVIDRLEQSGYVRRGPH